MSLVRLSLEACSTIAKPPTTSKHQSRKRRRSRLNLPAKRRPDKIVAPTIDERSVSSVEDDFIPPDKSSVRRTPRASPVATIVSGQAAHSPVSVDPRSQTTLRVVARRLKQRRLTFNSKRRVRKKPQSKPSESSSSEHNSHNDDQVDAGQDDAGQNDSGQDDAGQVDTDQDDDVDHDDNKSSASSSSSSDSDASCTVDSDDDVSHTSSLPVVIKARSVRFIFPTVVYTVHYTPNSGLLRVMKTMCVSTLHNPNTLSIQPQCVQTKINEVFINDSLLSEGTTTLSESFWRSDSIDENGALSNVTTLGKVLADVVKFGTWQHAFVDHVMTTVVRNNGRFLSTYHVDTDGVRSSIRNGQQSCAVVDVHPHAAPLALSAPLALNAPSVSGTLEGRTESKVTTAAATVTALYLLATLHDAVDNRLQKQLLSARARLQIRHMEIHAFMKLHTQTQARKNKRKRLQHSDSDSEVDDSD